ncbi:MULTISPECIES: hypothetical protein [unclassified Streptomyces]|uniref:hypothetical protein n=1 Tax=unclassified Streptomyces TaxID=2593676 RepID=UPI00362CFD63
MNKKYLILPAVLLAATAAVTAVRMWPSPLKDLRAQNLCLGMLTEKTARLLDDHKGGKPAVDEDRSEGAGADPVFSTVCFVGRGTSEDTTPRIQYTLDVRPADAPNEPMKGATPLTDGRSGWVGPRQSEVQLPTACPKRMKTDAPYVTVTLKVAPGVVAAENWDEAALTAASRTVALEAVDNLTEQYDCAA